MKFRGATDVHRRARERRWQELYKAQEDWLAEFMRHWAEHMERLMSERRAHAGTIAELALREVMFVRCKVNKDQVRTMVLILRQVWVSGAALNGWAKRAGIMHPTD